MTSTTPEGRVAAALRAATISRRWKTRKLRWEGRVGAPDYFVLTAGYVFLIECKQPGARPRPAQMLEFERLSASGMDVLVLDNAANAEALAEAIEKYIAGEPSDIDKFSFKRFRKWES